MLTVGREASGSIPNAGEGGVRLEEVCHDLCAINTKLVASDAANENQTKVSGGADSKDKECGSILDAGERLVDLECLSHVHSKRRSNKVPGQTANKNRSNASGGADSSEEGMRLRTLAFATLSCS